METSKLRDDYILRRWTVEDGLTEGNVRVIEHSVDGYLWIVTPHCLARFDGVRFAPLPGGGAPPGETTNLFFQHPEIVEELQRQLHAYRGSGHSRLPVCGTENG